MSHSAPTRPGKRERLVAAAAELVYQQGVENTTLAQIAEAADVPPGNVYYYFKTRDDLLRALIERRAEELRSLLRELEAQTTPRARLQGLAETWAVGAGEVAEHGCQVGCLASELTKSNPGVAGDARGLLEELIAWSEQQFREMDLPDPRALATSLIAGIQGAALVAEVLDDPAVMCREARRLERWIDGL